MKTKGLVKEITRIAHLIMCLFFVALLTACGGGSSSDSDDTTSTTNSAPIANAGTEQAVSTGALVTLDASASSDSDGDSLSYRWSITSMPDDSTATLSDTTSTSPHFTADVDGSYILSLTVNDGTTDSDADSIMVTASTASSENTAPVADAGNEQSVTSGSAVNLSGEGSSDANGDSLTYIWSLISIPTNSTASLDDYTIIAPSFTADIDGDYVITLVVNDGSEDSEPDTVTITAATSSSATELTYTIVDTAQTLCYDTDSGDEATCANEGYDADYDGNQPSYTLSADGLTVFDNNTRLTWQQSTDQTGDGSVDYDDKMSQADAETYCEALSYADREDWRLPSIKEAYSLILFSGEDASSYSGTDTSGLVPFIDEVFDWAFGDQDEGDRIIDAQYATTTLYTSVTMTSDDTMFGVNYVDGRIKGYPTKIKDFYVRCVTENTSYGENDFVDNGNETITDSATGLMWQQDDADSTSWDNAIEQCEAATTADYNDWRLPNTKELHSIVDYSVSPDIDAQASINSNFNATSITNEEGETDWGYYWASTTHANYAGSGTNAAYFSFGRALGYFSDTILDVHGAGAQRSNDKVDVSGTSGASSATGYNGATYYYHGPQGDILRHTNKLRCVRNAELDDDTDDTDTSDSAISTDGTMNILLIIGDDIGVDNISGYEEQPNYTAQTPSIDELADEGVLFRNAWTNPMCSPSRASLLTGRHAFRHGVTYPGKYGDLDSAEQTLAEVLSTANYNTALFGKWHLGDEDGLYPTDQGFDYYSGSLDNIDSYFAWEKTQITSVGGIVSTIDETDYATEVVATESLAWILAQTTPWFTQVAFNAPHSPFHVPPSSTYSNVELSGDEGDTCNLNSNNDDITDCYRAAAESMDTYIGELLAQIPADTLANTIVIFIGDNGTTKEAVIAEEGQPFLSEHGKGTMYEGGVNVPLVIWAGENVGLGTGEIADNVQLLDLFATIIDIANGSSDDDVEIDGQSLVGYLDEETTTPDNREYVFSELYSDSIDRWAISDNSIKYIYNETVEECYDLDADPSESTNLWDDGSTESSSCESLKENKPE